MNYERLHRRVLACTSTSEIHHTHTAAAERQGHNGTKGCRGTRTKRIKRLPSDRDETDQKAAERQGHNGKKGCRGTRTKRVKRLPSDNDTKERKAVEQHQTSPKPPPHCKPCCIIPPLSNLACLNLHHTLHEESQSTTSTHCTSPPQHRGLY